MMRRPGAVLAALLALALAGGVAASDGAARPPAQTQELLVRFEPGAAQARALAGVRASVVERLPATGLVRVRVDAGTPLAAAEAELERRTDVAYAEPNRTYRLLATPNDPFFASLWGLRQIEAPAAWDLSTGSDAITVAVVDSGVDYNHPDLLPNRWTNAAEAAGAPGVDDDANGRIDDLYGWDFHGHDASPLDEEGHGTHVAGTIGARGNNSTGVAGVSWQVKLMALRAGDAEVTTAAIDGAFRYACAKGARVVNGSFGAEGPGSYSQTIHDAIAACPNTLFVFSAGNGGLDGIGDDSDAARVYPCTDTSDNVVCVAASTPLDELASFSNFGQSVDLAAPGEDIDSTFPTTIAPFDYATGSGTSMAAPHVSGAAAVVAAHRPALSVAELKRAIVLSADPKPGLALVATGARLNLRRALAQETQPPAGLVGSSTTHQPNVWSNVQNATFAWSGATDANGIDGYSYALSPLPTYVPDDVKEAEENVTSFSTPLSDGVHWFHVRARDNVGNWSEAVHFGPITIDTFQPVRPVPSSPSHRVGGASAARTIDAAWSGASDSGSGLDGYSFSWSQGRAADPDEVKDAEEGVSRATSAQLALGAWWFNIRSRDNAGNWSSTVSLGPFSIKGGPTACAVPRLRGLTLVVAKRTLAKRGCAIGRVTRVRSRRVARGRVVAQRPAPGLRLRVGARISVVLSRGRR